MSVAIDLAAVAPLANTRAMVRMLLRPRGLVGAATGGVRRVVRQHFVTRDKEPNKMGWPNSGFFAREGVSKTSFDRAAVTDTKGEVVVNSPAMAFRMRGGTITPKRGRYLAIPATAEAYRGGSPSSRDASKTAFEFALRQHPDGGLRPALVRSLTGSQAAERRGLTDAVVFARNQRMSKDELKAERKLAALKRKQDANREGQVGRVEYWLVRRARIPADPRILPPPMILELEALEAARSFIRARLGVNPSPEAPSTS